MPSIFTIQGADKPRKGKGPCAVGTCKQVYNGRTKRHAKLCCVGKAKSRTGWKFVKA